MPSSGSWTWRRCPSGNSGASASTLSRASGTRSFSTTRKLTAVSGGGTSAAQDRISSASIAGRRRVSAATVTESGPSIGAGRSWSGIAPPLGDGGLARAGRRAGRGMAIAGPTSRQPQALSTPAAAPMRCPRAKRRRAPETPYADRRDHPHHRRDRHPRDGGARRHRRLRRRHRRRLLRPHAAPARPPFADRPDGPGERATPISTTTTRSRIPASRRARR